MSSLLGKEGMKNCSHRKRGGSYGLYSTKVNFPQKSLDQTAVSRKRKKRKACRNLKDEINDEPISS